MIIKGASRASPKQLAAHLGRRDTNERVEVLELQSPAGSLREAFRDWQTLSEGTRGRLGLYHANIDPAEAYTMTGDQWSRCVDVLEEELGLAGQPRAVVLHEKHGRQHIHVVWARTDIDTMTLRSDSHNYQAHERASQRLELEFGHDLVPGKHAKRDRERQPDMPDAAIDHNEWQIAERGQFDHKARKAQITALYRASDDGRAFKAALEDAGYILARGDKRDFVLLDADARVHSLGRQVQDVRAKELREFMADIDPNHLPSVQEARGILRDKPETPILEPSAPAPEPVPQVPEIVTPTDASPASGRLDALREKIEQRHTAALADQARRHEAVIEVLREKQERSAAEAIDAFAARQARQKPLQRPEEPEGLDRLWRTVREAVNEDAKAERFAAEERANDDAAARREIALNEMADAVYAANKAEVDKLIREQARERAELLSEQSRELARRLAEEQRRIALEQEYERRRLEAEARAREGPERDPRAR
jgi:hypothetical protein